MIARYHKVFSPILALAVFTTIASVTANASAQSRKSSAAAEALYLDGREWVEQGDFARGCPKLEASLELAAALGTMLLLAHCYEQLGKTASAWALFRDAEAAARANGDDRAEIARVRGHALDGRLLRLELRAAEKSPATLQIRRDGVPIPLESLGSALPVDPGEHRIELTAEGHESASVRVVIAPGATLTRVTLPALRRRVAPVRTAPDANAAPEPHGTSTGRFLAYGGAGLGAAAVVLGSTYALLARSEYDRSLEHCRTESLCSPRGLELRSDAERDARVSTVSFAAGGALLLTSTIVFFTSSGGDTRPRERTRAALSFPLVSVEPNGARVGLEGEF
jgi:hypothetical protein